MIRIETRDSALASIATGLGNWLDDESVGCKFKDLRLARQFRNLLEQICDGVGGSIPLACQDWANTKAAYRFLSNGRATRPIFFRATSRRQASSWPTVGASYLFCTILPSSPLKSASRHKK
jgi:hypothetical protein